jgi:hypothetical protein
MSYKPMDLIHHSRHQLRREALQRESLAYMFQLPDDGVAGYLYSWVDGESVAGSALFMYGPGIGEEPIEHLVTGHPVPYDMSFDDFRVGGMHTRHQPDPEVAEITYTSDTINIEYRFEATHPAYAYSNHPDGSPSFIADDRLEQSGHISGVIHLPDRDIPFDGMGHRDHSWGTRHWGIAQHWKWCETQAGPDLAVHFMELHAMGNRIIHGYVWRDGQMGELTDLDVTYEFDEDFWHTSAVAVVTDEHDRVTTMKGEVFARYLMTPHPESSNHEGSMRLTIEDVPGVGHLEMQWQRGYLDYIKNDAYMKSLATGTPAPGLHDIVRS